MSITSEELTLLLLVINISAVLKKQTKLFAKRRLRRWSFVLLAFLPTRNYEEVNISIILRASRKYTNAKSDYKNHTKRCLTPKDSIYEQSFSRMLRYKSLRLFRFKKGNVMRMTAVVR